MKLILILSLILLVSCEQGTTSGEQSPSSEPNQTSNFIDQGQAEQSNKIDFEIVEGFYRSGCVDYNGEKVEFYLDLKSYEIKVTKKEGVNANCEGLKDQVVAYIDINGDTLEYKDTEFFYFSDGGGTYPCGQSQMLSGNYYSIDGIGCSESFENTTVEFSKNDQGYYVINGVVFNQ